VEQASDGGDAGRRKTGASPRRQLARIREIEQGHQTELRATILEAMLRACGELGYTHVTVRAVLERYDGYRVQFYRQFANLGECYAAAYESEALTLRDEILRAGAAGETWRQGLRAALETLAAFAAERPLAARALLIDIHVAGEPAMAMRKGILERLSRAIDSARRETESRHSPPPLTALFMVSAIEAAVVSALLARKPERLGETMPELAEMVFAAYFDDERATPS
jgi:AcrR family transcriptional regulator